MKKIKNTLRWYMLCVRFWLFSQLKSNILLPKRIDEINVYNLWRLRRYVLANVTDTMFDMDRFYSEDFQGCGNIGCLLGYTPKALANITNMQAWRDQHSWSAFGKDSYNMWTITFGYAFLFSSDWTDVDNTRLGACARIKFVILNDNFDYNIDFFGKARCSMWLALYNSN